MAPPRPGPVAARERTGGAFENSSGAARPSPCVGSRPGGQMSACGMGVPLRCLTVLRSSLDQRAARHPWLVRATFARMRELMGEMLRPEPLRFPEQMPLTPTCATASSTAFSSFREQPMHLKDNQTLNLRAVGPIAGGVVWAIIDDVCNSCCHGEVWRQNAETKMKVLGSHPIWLHRKATTFNGVATSTTSEQLKIPMAIRLQESDMVIPGCVHSHDITEKTHPLFVSQACQVKLGMTRRVRDALDGHDAQKIGSCQTSRNRSVHDWDSSSDVQRLCAEPSLE